MSHEPEWCEYGNCRDTSAHEPECVSCHYLYGHKEIRGGECICSELRAAYRRGYNDHARSRAYAEAVYGPYNQHGSGENP